MVAAAAGRAAPAVRAGASVVDAAVQARADAASHARAIRRPWKQPRKPLQWQWQWQWRQNLRPNRSHAPKLRRAPIIPAGNAIAAVAADGASMANVVVSAARHRTVLRVRPRIAVGSR